ncbi:MAG: hypothetical protein AABY06_03670 [Nanoarchaeota archaeon]
MIKDKKKEEPPKKKIIFSTPDLARVIDNLNFSLPRSRSTPDPARYSKTIFLSQSRSELEIWIEHQIKEIEIKEEEIFSLIKEKTDVFSQEIKIKINLAKKFDVNLKKTDDRIRGIVEEGRKKYLESVEDLLNILNNLKKDRFENLIAFVDKVFLDFNKKSHLSYERATILIGKEMSEIKESLKDFSQDLIKLFNENQNLIDSSKRVSFIELKLKQLEKIKEELEKINLEIISLDKEIINKEKEKKEILNEIEKIKKSSEYFEIQKKEEKIKILKDELEKEIFNLRQIIDFKALGNFHHIFEDEMKIINSHKENFQINFQEDMGKKILKLLDGAKLNNKDISDKASKIHNKKEELLNFEAEFKNEKSKNQTNELSSKIAQIISEIEELKNKRLKEEKRFENLKINKDEIIKEIRENIENFGFEISD